MSPTRRTVRASQAFFEELDSQLREERGANGEPSRYDFQSHELFAIVERFELDWDRLPALLTGRDDYKILIGAGVLVFAFAVIGQLTNDGTIELISIDIEINAPGNNE